MLSYGKKRTQFITPPPKKPRQEIKFEGGRHYKYYKDADGNDLTANDVTRSGISDTQRIAPIMKAGAENAVSLAQIYGQRGGEVQAPYTRPAAESEALPGYYAARAGVKPGTLAEIMGIRPADRNPDFNRLSTILGAYPVAAGNNPAVTDRTIERTQGGEAFLQTGTAAPGMSLKEIMANEQKTMRPGSAVVTTEGGRVIRLDDNHEYDIQRGISDPDLRRAVPGIAEANRAGNAEGMRKRALELVEKGASLPAGKTWADEISFQDIAEMTSGLNLQKEIQNWKKDRAGEWKEYLKHYDPMARGPITPEAREAYLNQVVGPRPGTAQTGAAADGLGAVVNSLMPESAQVDIPSGSAQDAGDNIPAQPTFADMLMPSHAVGNPARVADIFSVGNPAADNIPDQPVTAREIMASGETSPPAQAVDPKASANSLENAPVPVRDVYGAGTAYQGASPAMAQAYQTALGQRLSETFDVGRKNLTAYMDDVVREKGWSYKDDRTYTEAKRRYVAERPLTDGQSFSNLMTSAEADKVIPPPADVSGTAPVHVRDFYSTLPPHPQGPTPEMIEAYEESLRQMFGKRKRKADISPVVQIPYGAPVTFQSVQDYYRQ